MLTPEMMLGLAPDFISDAFSKGVTPLGTILEFAAFGLTLIMFHVLARMIHGRGIGSMIGPLAAAKRDYRTAFIGVGLALLAVEIAPPYIALADIAMIRNFATWLAWIPVALVAITIQAGTEEVVYRGYLQQQLAVLSPRPIIWMGVPSVLFGLAHYFNGFGPAEGVLWAIWATFLGLSCADLTARTGNIGAAVGLHAANNLFAALIIGIEDWPASGLALFLYPYEDPAAYDYSLQTLITPRAGFEVLASSMVVLIMWLGARVALRR